MNKKLALDELGRKSLQAYQAARKKPIVVILDNIRSLNNVGSVFRTADAFLIEKIALCGITAQPPHRDIQKTALGATESVAWEYYPETSHAVKILREAGYQIVGIEQTQNSIELDAYQLPEHKKVALIFGNEVKGIQQEIVDDCDQCIEIPQEGTKHSLNISVAAGIVLWQFFGLFRP